MKELNPTQLKAMDQWLSNYKDIDKKIKVRKLELETISVNDINKGFSKGLHVVKHSETVVCRWDSDIVIQSLTTIKTAIDDAVSKLDNEQSDIYFYRWIIGLTWEEIGVKLKIKSKSIYRKRKKIIEIIAFNLGLAY